MYGCLKKKMLNLHLNKGEIMYERIHFPSYNTEINNKEQLTKWSFQPNRLPNIFKALS